MDENVSIDEAIEIFDCNGVSVAVEIELKDWRAECEKRALADTELDESGDRVLETALVPLKDEAEDLETDAERDEMVVTDVERDIRLLIVILAVIVVLKLVREDTDEVSDWSALLELYDDRVAIELTNGEYDRRDEIEKTAVIVESILLEADVVASCVTIEEKLADVDICDENVDSAEKVFEEDAERVNKADADDNAMEDVILVADASGDTENIDEVVTAAECNGEFVSDVLVVNDKSAEDVTIALLVIPLTVARMDIDEDKEGFEAVAIAVISEVDETDGLTREVEDSPEFVGSADIDGLIDVAGVTVPGSIVPENIDDELPEFVINAVAKDETVLPPDKVGVFVPLTSAVIVIVREGIGDEETLPVMVPITVTV